jgi:hypothetical protein
MSKTPKELAEEYTRDWWGGLPEAEGLRKSARENFLAGYKAAQAIVEEEIRAVQAQRVEHPGLGSAEYALKSALAKMGGK